MTFFNRSTRTSMNSSISGRSLLKIVTVGCVSAFLLSACALHKKQPEVAKVVKPVFVPPLQIKDISFKEKSRGSVSANVDFINNTSRTLQYVTFKTTAFDSKGNLVRANKTGRVNAWLRVAGPFAPGLATGDKGWDKVWKSRAMSCFRIDGAELIDNQGVVEYYSADQLEVLPQALAKGVCQGSTALTSTN